MVDLIQSFYVPDLEARRHDINYTLSRNLLNPIISRICLIINDQESQIYLSDLAHPKLSILVVDERPTYGDLFRFSSRRKNICIIANADIWLHHSSCRKTLSLVQDRIVFALTRHEHDMTKPEIDNYRGSHDAFIVKPPLVPKIFRYLNHHQNILGAENVVIYELQKFGYRLFNPATQVKIIHQHQSNIRQYIGGRINIGDINADGEYQIRSGICMPSKSLW